MIDHIVYCVKDLDASIIYTENILGIAPTLGGNHESKGTKNALLHLGVNCYLELLAVDTNNPTIKPPRWMGIDLIQTSCITRWSMKSPDLLRQSNILSTYNSDLGGIETGKRTLFDNTILEWKLSKPLASPAVEIVPFLIDWSASESHPSDTLIAGCSILSIDVRHPTPNLISPIFKKLGINMPIRESSSPSINVTIRGPKGILTI